MDQPTGSVSGRGGWEWNRLQRDELTDSPEDTTAATPQRSPQQRIEQLEEEVARLREEIDRREQQQATIIRQYERELAERNRELTDRRTGETFVESLLSSLR